MTTLNKIELFCFAPFIFFMVVNTLITIVGKKYVDYTPIAKCTTFWSWVHFSWNYIGAKEFMGKDRTPTRHIGVRWFGFSFEYTEEIPMGELRF